MLYFQVKDVSALAQLSILQTLNLDGTDVTEASLTQLATHPALSSLSLAGIPVSDGNLALQIISGLYVGRRRQGQIKVANSTKCVLNQRLA